MKATGENRPVVPSDRDVAGVEAKETQATPPEPSCRASPGDTATTSIESRLAGLALAARGTARRLRGMQTTSQAAGADTLGAAPALQVSNHSACTAPQERLRDEMQTMLQENQIEWGPPSFRMPAIGVRLEQGKPFHQWLFMKGPAPHRMNCWESVLYGAFRAGLIDKAAARNMIALVDHQTDAGAVKICSFIKNILDRAAQASTTVTNLAARSADHLDMRCIDIPAGHVVLFGEDGQHVALSLGANEVLELDSDSGGGDHQGRMAISRIDAIMNKKAAYARQLAWAPLL